MRRAWYGPALEVLPFVAAALLWLAPLTLHPTSVAFWRGGAYSDLLISHWPNAILLHRGLFDAGRIPLWNPTILSGTPFAADPLSGMWYLPNWLAALYPEPISFNLLFVFHLAWAGWGAARLAKTQGVGKAGALVSGLAFAGAPKIIGHIGLGHLGLVESICWTPWVLVAVGSSIDSLSRADRAWLRRSALLGVTLGLTFLADPRWSVPAAMTGLAYAFVCIARSHRESPKTFRWSRIVGGAAFSGAFALGISACMAIPLWEFVQLSTRAGLSSAERAGLSLPWDQLAGIVVPDFGGWPEWVAYPGIAVILSAALALAGSKRTALFWWAVALVGLLLALGSAIPLLAAAVSLLPGLSLLRVPARFLFLLPLGLAIAAGIGVDSLFAYGETARSHKRMMGIAIVVSALMLAIAVAQILASGGSVHTRAGALSGIALTLLALTWVLLMLRGTIGAKIGMAGWVFLICADLALMAFASLRVVTGKDALVDRALLAARVAQDGGGGRALSPSYSLPQPASVVAGLELADGIDPLQLAAYRDFMAKSLGFSPDGYSVTLPPFPEGDPRSEWPMALDSEQLGLLNVTEVVSEFPLEADGLVLATTQEGAYVYRNEKARPRAWMQPSQAVTEVWTPVDEIDRAVDDMLVRATGPGTLVISEIAYPGWRVTIDGREAPIDTVYGILRGVQLPEGAHDVEFVFRPMSVYWGGGLTLLTLLALAWVWIKR